MDRPSPFIPFIVCSPHSSAVKPTTEYPLSEGIARRRSGGRDALCEIWASATVSKRPVNRLPGGRRERRSSRGSSPRRPGGGL
ncbi:MAG: hypothetical protein AVDCRST_MAG03-313 [uncultured Rubrobacteraceae bacterium]|uniref:Uncharacterized protein n=1 Tax=uncultured Rubrobacteraceae bacterium TaxID=349277 RepID=A0A6J4NGR6_9ACTN|nr:MAG: hypothetical protein AVDCRST_MAG03-313 [uncultured Rubrobacteraceae bacterium]